MTSIIDKSALKHAKFIIVGYASGVLKVESNLKKLGVTKKQIVDERPTMREEFQIEVEEDSGLTKDITNKISETTTRIFFVTHQRMGNFF